MRRFWLEIVGKNATIDLNGEGNSTGTYGLVSNEATAINNASGKLMLTDVSGLGFERDNSYSAAGSFGFVKTKSGLYQTVVAGVLNIKRASFIPQQERDPYVVYNQLVRMIINNRAVKLRLHYSPSGSMDYMLDGEITKLTKTELSASRLACGFEFKSESTWYTTFSENYTTSGASSPPSIGARPGAALSEDKNAFAYVITMTQSAPILRVEISRPEEEALAILSLAPPDDIAVGDVIVWSNDPDNPTVTLNGSDAMQYVQLTLPVFEPIYGSGLKFYLGYGATVAASYKCFYPTV